MLQPKILAVIQDGTLVVTEVDDLADIVVVDTEESVLSAIETDFTDDLALKAPIADPTFTGTVAGITKAMVGLSNVTNTADASKPVSTAQQTALDLKAPLASPTFTGTVTLPAAVASAFPTTDPNVAGRVWANSGVLTVSAG